MDQALLCARQAVHSADVPVGALVLGPDGSILATGKNQREAHGDPCAHAEIQAIRAAAQARGATPSAGTPSAGRGKADGWAATECGGLGCEPVDGLGPKDLQGRGQQGSGQAQGRWRLDGCTLVVTLEPCLMCAGALLAARLDRLVFGAWDAKAGACGSVWDLVRDSQSLHQVQVLAGVREAECAQLLHDFFVSKRSA